ncbi:HlyD family secretion protein [Larsenimonas rhizosphaerae]|uniref:HlyD family secretion protein n=1 Tax=Larsenimonas rhizosphaerae TaxID=2944682 RepID=UPI0020346BC5|nr:HlyD family secretion protein [Larsenimonas rhizosphaerae]MCM2129605.1 HlyD family secretion protein [Larsenimonas rhizosphaerae]
MASIARTWIKRLIIALVIVVLLLAGLWKGWHWWQAGRFIEETDNAYLHADSVAIRSELNTRVIGVNVDHNQRVHAGDTLVTLDPTDYQDDLAQARAQLAQARAAVTRAERSIELQKAVIEQRNADIASAAAQLKEARQTLSRTKTLVSKSYSSRQQLDSDQAGFDVAQARVSASKAALTSARRQLSVDGASLEDAEASRDNAQAALQAAQHQLDKTHITAPFGGVVGNVTVEPGTYAQPSLTLMTLVPVDSLYVVANYKETQVARMRVGQSVHIEVDAYPDTEFTGVVESLAPATGAQFSLLPQDNATGNFNKIVQRIPVRIRLTGPEKMLPYLHSGLSVVPSVDTRDEGQGLYVAAPLSGPVVRDITPRVPGAD